MHRRGADGARRAKRWLDATTRTKASWTNEDEVSASRMEFRWPSSGQEPFSFDVGGILAGGDVENHLFMAEVKYYSSDGLGRDYDDFVAKCYLARRDHPRSADQYMFLTWHPFRVKTWTRLESEQAVLFGLAVNHHRAFGSPDERAEPCFGPGTWSGEAHRACPHMDMDVVRDVATRLWVVVLSEKQEGLVISDDDRALVISNRAREGRL